MMLFLIEQVELDDNRAGCLDCLVWIKCSYSGQHNVQNIKIIERLKVTMFLSVPGVYSRCLERLKLIKKI